MSMFEYAGVAIPYAYTTDCSQEAVYDPSQTDRMYTKFDLTVQGVLNTSLAEIAGMNPALATNAPAMMEYLRSRLMTPRQILKFTFAGNNLLPQPDNAQGTDAANGPHPQACKIHRLTTTTFLISFRVVTHLVEGEDGGTGGSPVVSNRWEETQSIDDCNYVTRTRRGSYTIRSDNLERVTADQLREKMCVLAVPQGFVRDSSEYTISQNGLTINFAIVDRQTWVEPPRPAFKATGDYTETSSKFGTRRLARCWVNLEGDALADKGFLMRTAVEICSNQLLLAKGKSTNGSIARIDTCEVSHSLYENKVRCTITAIVNPWWGSNTPQARVGGVAGIDFRALAKFPLGSEPGTPPPAYMSRGSVFLSRTPNNFYSAFLQAAQYYDPALAGVQLSPQTGVLTEGTTIGTGRGR